MVIPKLFCNFDSVESISSRKMKLQIASGTIITPETTVTDSSVFIEDGKIIQITSGTDPVEGYEFIDASNMIVGPGGIDMHFHGGGGHDFMECTEEAFRIASHTHLLHGTTGQFPTLASSTTKMIEEAANICSRLMHEEGSPVLGLHLEGPYFNIKKCGGQMPGMIRLPKPEEYLTLLDKYPCIRRWDAAPELVGAQQFAQACKHRGVVAGIGHTDAVYDDIEKGCEAGFSHAVHFYNAMSGVHNVREFKVAGAIESILLLDQITVELIADGIHVPPVIMQLVEKVKGADSIALVTDAMAPAGADSTEVFDPNTIIEDGVCKLADRSALAGSIATMDRLISTMINKCHFSWNKVFRMSSTTPARIMGVADRKGSLTVGMDADICIYTQSAELRLVIQNGKLIK